ncbi:Ubiquitin-protein ligase [Mycena chlorophos]|uniref:HECT-type E3 ubiquitin transferase n=1 Tax=Mycena chlorophos TaxID=658473 RepID=A0A8H6WHM9_MYCCL|nr:Ubiquitin-protein ligase [Mycena chlorophos]
MSELKTSTEENGYFACTNCHTRSNNRCVVATPMLEVLKWMDDQLDKKLVGPAELLEKTRAELQHGALSEYHGYYRWIALRDHHSNGDPVVFDCVPPSSTQINGMPYQVWDRRQFKPPQRPRQSVEAVAAALQAVKAEALQAVEAEALQVVEAEALQAVELEALQAVELEAVAASSEPSEPNVGTAAKNPVDGKASGGTTHKKTPPRITALKVPSSMAPNSGLSGLYGKCSGCIASKNLKSQGLLILSLGPPSRSVASALTINKPVRDPNLNGKKRAAPEPSTSDKDSESPGPSTKRPRTTSYSLRSSAKQSGSTSMPSNTTTKSKTPAKSKASGVAGSSRTEHEDAEMLDVEEFNKQEEGGDNENEDEPDAGVEARIRRFWAASTTQRRCPFSATTFGSHVLSLLVQLKTMLNNIKSIQPRASLRQGDDNVEAQVDVLMAALPGVAHIVVYHGAIPVLCSKLIEISYIDLAEQTLSMMEKISEEFPSSIVRDNGLAALLNYLDFFSIAVQPTALRAVANCCRNISPKHASQIKEAWPIIRNCLGYSDQRQKMACLITKPTRKKSLGRLMKAKAKAERAAARQATQATLAAAMLAPAPAAGPSDAATPSAEDGTTSGDTIVAEPDEAIISAPAPDRLEMLRSKLEAVGRFMELMVYAASVISSIPIKTLTALLKAVSFLDPDGLKRVLTFVPVASFTSSILSSKGHPTLVIGALQVVDLLLTKKRKGRVCGSQLKAGNNSLFANFVKKLQESLTKMEFFEVVTVTPGPNDSNGVSPSLPARQLRLVADDQADIPRNLHNIVVSIHAIATFQAPHDYLRARVAGLLGTGSRLSGMLAALANSGFPGVPRPPAPEDASTSAQASSSSRLPPGLDCRCGEQYGRSCRRRRANMVDAEMANYNDEDEVDAEVFDEEIDRYNPIANKTLTLSVGEG